MGKGEGEGEKGGRREGGSGVRLGVRGKRACGGKEKEAYILAYCS